MEVYPNTEVSTIEGEFSITGAGGEIIFYPFEVQHGTITSLGFRINDAIHTRYIRNE